MAADINTPPVGDAHDGDPVAEAAEAVHGHEVPAGAAEVAQHGGEGGGLPQFEFEYWGGQIVWLLLIFALLYVLLGRVFVPRLRRVVDERATAIANAVAEAKRVRTEADEQARAAQAEIDQARADARRMAADAQAKAAAELAQRQGEQERELDQRLSEAEASVRAKRDQAMSNVRGIADETAQAMIAKLTGRPATQAELDAAFAGRIPEGVA